MQIGMQYAGYPGRSREGVFTPSHRVLGETCRVAVSEQRFTGNTPPSGKPKGFWGELHRKLSFYGPILWASTMCSVFNHPKVIEKWEPRAIFSPSRLISVDKLASASLKSRIQEVDFPSLDGTMLNGWYVPARSHSQKPTIVLAHGNQGNMMRVADIIQAFTDRGYGVMAFDYRGYGKSQGQPSEQGLYQDFEAACRYLTRHPSAPVPIGNQIPLGESLGGGVVVGSISRRVRAGQMPDDFPRFKAVILSSTFTSLPDFYRAMKARMGLPAWIFPMEKRITQTFDSLQKMPDLAMPLLFIHGDDDPDVPPAMTQTLQHHAPNPAWTQRVGVPGGGHSGLFTLAAPLIFQRLEALLQRVEDLKQTPVPSEMV